jgi:hypothetical protein
MTFDSTAVTNTLLACFALTNIIILTIIYESTKKQK